MKLILLNSNKIKTDLDAKLKDIKKYADNLDFNQDDNESKNLLKRIALLTLNEDTEQYVTIRYGKEVSILENIEILLAQKIKNKEVLIKVLGDRDKFINEYSATETEIESDKLNQGFINWDKKTNTDNTDWTDLNFLEERIRLTSLNDVLNELIKKNNKIYLSNHFFEEFIQSTSENNIEYYFSKLSEEDILSSDNKKNLLKLNDNKWCMEQFFKVVLKNHKENKEIKNFIKNDLINEDNLKYFVTEKNINTTIYYVPNNLKHNVLSIISRNLNGFDYKIDMKDVLKFLGKSFLQNKENLDILCFHLDNKNFSLWGQANELIVNLANNYDLNNDDDKKFFYNLINYNNTISRVLSDKIIEINKEKLNKNDILNLYLKDKLQYNENDILKLIEKEEDLETVLSYKGVRVTKVLNALNNPIDLLSKKSNIISFLKISSNNWLKDKKIPENWKEDNDLLMQTYGKSYYNDLPLSKRKEIEENKDNIKTLLHLNSSNFNVIRSKEKYDIDVLRVIAYENASEFRSIMDDIPKANWYNFNYVLNMLDLHPKSIYFIPEILFTNKTFTLSFFEKLEEKNKRSYVNDLPEKVKSFLQENNITDNYTEKLTRHFNQDYFEKTIEEKQITTKKNKI